MIYKVGLKGYALVEADSKKEAMEKADQEDHIEEVYWYTSARPLEDDEI